MTQKIKYLAIGHCCHDRVGDDNILGGTVSYSSMLAQKLGADSSMLTSFGDDFLFEKEFATRDITVHNIPAEKTTVFENIYVDDSRRQTILARAEDITDTDYKKLDDNYDIVQLSPIADEIDSSLITQVNEGQLCIATPQGWLRQWGGGGEVSYKPIDWSQLSQLDVVIISEEDVPDLKASLSDIERAVKTLIVTKGTDGAVVYANKVEAHFPAYPASVIDPTGAGDTFATGFIIRYAQTKELVESMIFANCLASICVEHKGVEFFNHITSVDQRIELYKKNLLDLSAGSPLRIK